MYLKYGTYQHAPEEASLASLTVQPEMNARGHRLINVVTAHVNGELCLAPGETQYDLSTRITALSNAFDVDGLDFGLYHDNGTATPHFLSSSHPDNLTGNQVIYKSFPANHGGEYTTGREFAYAIQAKFRAASSLLMSYRESITHVGTTGPIWRWQNNRNFGPTVHRDAPASYQVIKQSGMAETLTTYLLPPAPILGQPFNLVDQNTITRIGPIRYPRGFVSYVVKWDYTFCTPTIHAAFPTLR